MEQETYERLEFSCRCCGTGGLWSMTELNAHYKDCKQYLAEQEKEENFAWPAVVQPTVVQSVSAAALPQARPRPHLTAPEPVPVVKTEREEFDLTQIPVQSLFRLGKVFREGETKYDRDNWRLGAANKAYQLERANHGLKHLLLYIDQLQHSLAPAHEDDLAKAAWFCLTQMELERLSNEQ